MGQGAYANEILAVGKEAEAGGGWTPELKAKVEAIQAKMASDEGSAQGFLDNPLDPSAWFGDDEEAMAAEQREKGLGVVQELKAGIPQVSAPELEQYGHIAASPTLADPRFQYGAESEQDAARTAATADGGWQSPYEVLQQAGPSQAAQATADPWAIAGQYSGMAGLGETYGGFKDIYAQGGMTAIDRARQEESKNRELAVSRGQREALAQEMEMRGMAGSGSEMAQAIAAQEAATGRQSATSLGTEAMALQRRDAALGAMGATAGQLGALSGDVRGASFDEAYSTGAATDQTSQFNVGMSADRERRRAEYEQGMVRGDVDRRTDANRGNVDLAREGAIYDVGERNRANWANTGQENESRWFDTEEPWRKHAATERATAMETDQYGGIAGGLERERERERGAWKDVVGGATTLGAAYIGKDKG